MRLPKNLGMILLGAFLIAFGLVTGVFGIKLSFEHAGNLLSLLAIVAGVLLLLGR